ncbi:MAG TPA: MBL fold metallo-hydrolase [Gaiellaceae bacterium]|nr:MBL fold metallo-hydrolase [Gaiellaceae bacterium]
MRELQPGLWHWQAPHPAWTHDQWWPQAVSSYAFDDGVRLLLFDPLAVPEEILALAAGREPVIVLTAPWHERDAPSLVERLGAPVYTPPPDTAGDLIRKYGLDPAEIPDGLHSSDLEWLVVEGRGEAHVFAAGDRLPIGVEVFPGRSHNDVVLWLERVGAVVTGDSLVDFDRGFEVPQEVVEHGCTREQVIADLRPLLELPVELVLPAHGAPTDRAALERALGRL